MVVIGAIADNQVEERSRLDEHDRVMQAAARIGREAGVQLWVHGGDIFDNPRGSTARERASVHQFLQTVTERAPVVIAGGNHEAPGEVEELGRLESRWPIYALERPGVHVVQLPAARAEAVAVAVLPWPRKANLLAAIGHPVSPKEADAAAREELRKVLLGLGWEIRPHIDAGLPSVLVAHGQIMGSTLDNDQPRAGLEMTLTLDDLALASCRFNVIGHVHKPQEWTHGGVPFVIPGSPRLTSHSAGECLQKGLVLARFEGRELLGWERVPLPSTPLVLLEGKWVPKGETLLDLGELADGPRLIHKGLDGSFVFTQPFTALPAGAEVRVRYSVAADRRAAARASADFLRAVLTDQGAASVTLDEKVEAAVLARSPATAAAVTLRDKFSTYLDAKKIELTPERRARLLDRLDAIEASTLEGGTR